LVHRADGAGRPRRPVELRAPARRAARGHGRPWPPRAADPSRLRREEPPDPTRRGGRRHSRRGAPRRAAARRRPRGGAPVKHLLSIRDLDAAAIAEIHDLTDSFVEVSNRPIPKVPALRGKTVAWLFYEDSTRTRTSFEAAARRLSADTVNFSV